MVATVKINEMADVIMQGLTEYAELATDDMKEAVKHASTTVRKEIKANAPEDTGKYAKSWTAKKVRETSQTLTMVVHSRNRYQKPNKAAIKLPLRDGDIERDDEAYKGHYFINANSTTAPQIVDRAVKPILDRGEVYSGCYARVSLNFYAFNSNGNKGIACGLGNIQKIRDGESLGGKTSAADDFGTVADDDFLA